MEQLVPHDVTGRNDFPDCVTTVPVSLWGFGGEAAFARSCVCVRNRSQLSASGP